MRLKMESVARERLDMIHETCDPVTSPNPNPPNSTLSPLESYSLTQDNNVLNNSISPRHDRYVPSLNVINSTNNYFNVSDPGDIV